MKRHSLLESLKRLIPELPRLDPATAGSGAPVLFSSTGGGDGGGRYDDPDNDFYDEAPEEEPRAPRRDEPQATAARRRTVQSEPDDRYWTDYLRIALPVIGLLLVIAVFWYWAQQLIDDGSDDDLTATEPAGIAEVVDGGDPTPPSTPDAAQPETQPDGQQVAPPTTVPADDAEGQAQPTVTPEVAVADADAAGDSEIVDALAGLEEAGGETDTGEADTGETAGTGGIQPDMTVVVTEEGAGVALRSEFSVQGGEETVITRLDPGTPLTVVSGPEEAEEFTWWQVVTDTGEQGWVAEDFIEPAA